MRVNREELMHCLEAVSPGLGGNDLVEQSDCYIFLEGRIVTFNEELCCQIRSPLPVNCAVPAKELRALLGKLKTEDVDIELEDAPDDGGTKLLVKGKGRAGLSVESQIALPFNAVTPPSQWNPVPVELSEAISMTSDCASKAKRSKYVYSCLHMTPYGIEATNGKQAACYNVELPLEEQFVVRAESMKALADLGMEKISVAGSWVHFKNLSGLIYSVRRNVMHFPNVRGVLEGEGELVTLPPNLKDALVTAGIFSKTAVDGEDTIYVHLRPGKMMIEGRGVHGWYKQPFKAGYEGKPFAFAITRTIFEKILAKTNECEVSDSRLFIRHGNFEYVSCLIALRGDEE